MKKAEKEVSKNLGAEKAAELRKNLEQKAATDKAYQKKLNQVNNIGTAVLATAAIGGAGAALGVGAGGAGIAKGGAALTTKGLTGSKILSGLSAGTAAIKKVIPKKVAEISPTTNSGNVVEGVVSGNGMLQLDKKQSSDNMKNSGLEIGPNVITGMPVIGSNSPIWDAAPNRRVTFPNTSEFSPLYNQAQQPLQASLGNFELNPMTIGIIVVAIILLVIAAKNK
jgi:hypothetical protein